MSISVFAGIGLRINPSRIFVSNRKYNEYMCDCKIINKKEQKFCSECGNWIWKTGRDWIPEVNDDDATIFGYQIVEIYIDTDKSNYFIIHKKFKLDYGHAFKKINFNFEDFGKVKEEMKIKLSPLNLWDEKAFGVYQFGYDD